jgi:ribosomal protein L6P/L9E
MKKNNSILFFKKFNIIRYLKKKKKIKLFFFKTIYNFIIFFKFFNSLKTFIKNTYKHLKKGYIFRLNFKGLNFAMFNNKKKKSLKINISYSHSIIFNYKKYSDFLKIITTKNYIYLYGYSKDLLLKYIYLFYKLRKINKYKNVGILLPNKKYKYKIGKRKK